MSHYYSEADDDGLFETADERALERGRAEYRRQLRAHPDPRDPDHPEPIEDDEQ